MLSLAKYIKKKIELRENLVGTGFLLPPKALDKAAKQYAQQLFSHRVTVIGEIASATGFKAQNIYITYHLMLPENGWLFEDENEEPFCYTHDRTSEYNKRSGLTQISSGRVDIT